MIPQYSAPARGSRGGAGLHTSAAVGTVALAAAIDQLTKWWALQVFRDGHVVDVLPSVTLRLVFNPGAAFGMGSSAGAPLVIGLIGVLAGLLVWIVVRIRRRERPVGTIALAAAAGGGIGNLIDRIFRAEDGPLTGHVVDFIAVDWFAIFNVADIFTTSGIALWALATALGSHPDRPDRAA